MSSSEREEKRPKIEMTGYLECSVCLDFPASPIFTCAVGGHVVCGICKWKDGIQKCPTCQDENLTVNRFVERILKSEGVKFPCRNSQDGCRSQIQPSTMELHLTLCNFRPIVCDKIWGKPCDKKSFSPTGLLKHWIEDHNISKTILYRTEGTEDPNYIGSIRVQLKLSRLFLRFYGSEKELKFVQPAAYCELDGHTFIIHFQGEGEAIHTWMTLVGEESVAKRYKYTGTVSSKNIKKPNRIIVTEIPVHCLQYWDLKRVNMFGHTFASRYNNLRMLRVKGEEMLDLEWDVQLDISKLPNHL